MTKPGTKSIAQQVFHFPLTKIIVGVLVVGGTVALGQMGVAELLTYASFEKNVRNLVMGIVTAVLSLCSYTLLFRYYEKRPVSELSTKGIGRNLIIGCALGVVLQSLTILVIYLSGGFSIIAVNPLSFLIPPLTMALTSAIFEEILVRGIIFRILEEKLGSYLALFISALIFGALHIANPNSSVIAALGLALQAGCFLAAAYIYSRSLWFPIAIHFGWNFTQGGIFGAAVSGSSIGHSLFTTHIQGAEWITGGLFGPEGSVQATVFCSVATLVLLILSHKQGKLIKPFWVK